MYKIVYLKTGHIFELPEITAKNLKKNSPDDYKIVEKNGKKCRDVVKKKMEVEDKNSILWKVKED